MADEKWRPPENETRRIHGEEDEEDEVHQEKKISRLCLPQTPSWIPFHLGSTIPSKNMIFRSISQQTPFTRERKKGLLIAVLGGTECGKSEWIASLAGKSLRQEPLSGLTVPQVSITYNETQVRVCFDSIFKLDPYEFHFFDSYEFHSFFL